MAAPEFPESTPERFPRFEVQQEFLNREAKDLLDFQTLLPAVEEENSSFRVVFFEREQSLKHVWDDPHGILNFQCPENIFPVKDKVYLIS